LINEWPNLNFKGHSILYLFTINKAADYSNWVQRARFTFGPRFTSAELHLAGFKVRAVIHSAHEFFPFYELKPAKNSGKLLSGCTRQTSRSA